MVQNDFEEDSDDVMKKMETTYVFKSSIDPFRNDVKQCLKARHCLGNENTDDQTHQSIEGLPESKYSLS